MKKLLVSLLIFASFLNAAENMKTFWGVPRINIKTINGVANTSGDITNGLIGWWKFNEGSGTDAADDSGGNNDGTLTNGVTWTTGPNATGAISLDGTDDFVDVANEANFDLDFDDPHTVTAWINWDSDATGPLPFFSKQQTTGNTPGIDYRVDYLNALLKAYQINGSGIALQGNTPVTTLPADGWHFVAITYDGSGDGAGFTLYVDNDAGEAGTAGSVGGSMLNNNPAWIGKAPAGFFWGSIDDLRVYNRELSGVEIATLFAGGAK